MVVTTILFFYRNYFFKIIKSYKNTKTNQSIKTCNIMIKELSMKIAVAWILRHPAKMQTIVGTTNKERLKDICTASRVELSREEWYEIYRAAGNKLP